MNILEKMVLSQWMIVIKTNKRGTFFSKQYKKKKEEMTGYALSKDEKIPIVISSTYSIHIQIDAGEDISCGNFCGEKFGKSIEKGIESAIAGIKYNAEVHLRLVKERRIMPTGNEWIAEKNTQS
jgi:hypothetical protein